MKKAHERGVGSRGKGGEKRLGWGVGSWGGWGVQRRELRHWLRRVSSEDAGVPYLRFYYRDTQHKVMFAMPTLGESHEEERDKE